jgi:hypothetical protein
MLVPHRKHLRTSTPCYGDSFTFLYVPDVRTSQETHLWVSKACYGYSFTYLYVDDILPHRKHAHGPPLPVTEIALLLSM